MADPDDNAVAERLSLTEREMLYRVRWFIYVRWIMGSFALLMLLASWYVLGIRFRSPEWGYSLAPAMRAASLIFIYNAAFALLIHVYRKGRLHKRQIMYLTLGQIVCDMLAVCTLVHYSGGIENYFLVLILLPLVIATELLPQKLAYATAGLAVAMISLLAWGEQSGTLRHVQIVWPGERTASAPYFEPFYVLEVLASLTMMIFATVFVASSISQRLRHREAQLEDAYHRLHQADENKSFFMRKAGHEMRAPLAAIHSILDVISAQPNISPQQQADLIARSRHRLQALMNLVDELRRYSRLRTDNSPFAFHHVSLDRLAGNAVALFRQQAEEAGLDLSARIQEAAIAGDEELLRELVTNLLANAIQYTPRGGRVDLELERDHSRALLRVSDTGIGISEQAREKLFQEFFRSNEARKVFPQGTGLGLAICKRIVDLHHGQIDAVPRDGGGTTFRVTLPLDESEP